jgi:transposase InsO family protein
MCVMLVARLTGLWACVAVTLEICPALSRRKKSAIPSLPPGALVGVAVRIGLAGDGAGVGRDVAALVIGAGEGSGLIGRPGHTQLDLWAKRDNGQIARPWLTIVIDDYSRAIAGFLFSFDSPSAAQTALALRQAIWRKSEAHWIIFGIPEALYTDNGSDFTSMHLEQVAADIKMRLIFSTPGQPRGRGRIERFFATVNQMFLCTLPGYIDRGAVRDQPSLTLADLDRCLRDFLREYHARPHGETRVPPQERWQQGGFIPRMAESLEQLDLLLLTIARTRKVQPDGVRFQGMRYIDPTLAAYIGETVLVRYDPRDIAEIRLFHQGKFLCRAIYPELAGQTVAQGHPSSAGPTSPRSQREIACTPGKCRRPARSGTRRRVSTTGRAAGPAARATLQFAESQCERDGLPIAISSSVWGKRKNLGCLRGNGPSRLYSYIGLMRMANPLPEVPMPSVRLIVSFFLIDGLDPPPAPA